MEWPRSGKQAMQVGVHGRDEGILRVILTGRLGFGERKGQMNSKRGMEKRTKKREMEKKTRKGKG